MKDKPNTCAKCDEPRSTTGYCYTHRREYQLRYAEKKRGGPSKQKLRRRHGCTYKPWYPSYAAMVRRAAGKHGGRCYEKVDICPEWLNDPRVFGTWAEANGFVPGLTIERKDPTRGYSPDNCEWISASLNSQRGQKTSPPIRGSDGRFIGRELHTGVAQ